MCLLNILTCNVKSRHGINENKLAKSYKFIFKFTSPNRKLYSCYVIST